MALATIKRRSIWPALSLAIAIAGGCATRFEEPSRAEPHAVLVFPPQQSQWFSRVFLEPQEINGLPRPRNWMREEFAVPPGALELQVRAAREDRQGSCALSFTAMPGERYRVHAEPRGDTFIIQALSEEFVVASCETATTVLPTPLGPPPGVPRA